MIHMLVNSVSFAIIFFRRTSEEPKVLIISRTDQLPKKSVLEIYLSEPVKDGSLGEIEIEFSADVTETVEGIFKGSFSNERSEKS